MAQKLVLLFGFVAALTIVAARVVREAPKDDTMTFSEFFDTANKNLNDLRDNFLKALGVSSTEDLQNKAVAKGKEFAQTLDTWAVDIKKDTENLKDNPAIKSLRETVDKVYDDFKKEHPETAEDVKKYIDEASKGTEEIVSKLKTLSESEDAKNVKDLGQKLLDTTSTTFQNFAKQIKDEFEKP